VLVVKDHPEQVVRVGVAAGRSLGNAVNRNRAKRRLRAAIQPDLPNIRAGHDLILIARQPILQATFPEIRSALGQILRRAELMKRHDE
jgi:ribonuclease P protein component